MPRHLRRLHRVGATTSQAWVGGTAAIILFVVLNTLIGKM